MIMKHKISPTLSHSAPAFRTSLPAGPSLARTSATRFTIHAVALAAVMAVSALEHAAIAEGIAARNPDIAAAATQLHLHHSLEHIKAHSGTREDT